MRLLAMLFLIGLSPWAMAKEFKMPCADYEALTDEKVCDIAPMIPTSTEEIESIKARQKHQACIADFKAKYPQCWSSEPVWLKDSNGKSRYREHPEECYVSKKFKVTKLEKLCPSSKKELQKTKPKVKTIDVWN